MLILVLSFGMVTSSFAGSKNNLNLNTIKDNETKRVVEIVEGNIKEVITLNKKTNILTTKKINIDTKKVISIETKNITKLNNIIKSQNKLKLNKNELSYKSMRFGSDHYQNTFLNYEYEEYSDGLYELRRKDDYEYRSINDDQDAIAEYVSAVDILNNAEIAVGTAFLFTVGAAIATYISGGLTAKEALVAAGATTSEAAALGLAIQNCESTWKIYID